MIKLTKAQRKMLSAVEKTGGMEIGHGNQTSRCLYERGLITREYRYFNGLPSKHFVEITDAGRSALGEE